MAIRMSGLTSGLDTESIVSAMVSTYRSKVEKYQKAQTKLSWKSEAWSSVNSQVYSLYSNISSLRFTSAYSAKKTTVSDTTKATVTASSSAVNGSQSLKINKLAKSAYITGGKLASGTTADTKVSSLISADGLGSLTSGTFTVNNADGTSTDITIDDSTTISGVVEQLNSAGLKASYDSTNQRLFISASGTGSENSFTLTAADDGGLNALLSLGIYVGSTSSTSGTADTYAAYLNQTYVSYTEGTDGTYSLTDSDIATTKSNVKSILTQLQAAQNQKTEAQEKIDTLTKNQSYADAYKALYEDYDASQMTALFDAMGDETTLTEETNQMAYDLGLLTFTGSDDKTYTLDEINVLTDDDGNVTGYELKTPATDDDGNAITITSDSTKFSEALGYRQTIKDFVAENYTDEDGNVDEDALTALRSVDYETELQEANDSLDAANAVIDANSDLINRYNIDLTELATATDSDMDDISDTVISKLQAACNNLNGVTSSGDDISSLIAKTASATSVRIDAQDAEISLNGAIFSGSSNTFSINGLTITCLAETGNDEVSITTDTDAQGLYDNIKDFLSEYNDVINNLMATYNAESASGYDPLTDDEKESMTDSQIEKWESKIKASLLRRDSTLNGVISTMTNSMMKSYTVTSSDGTTKSYSLANFGISTLGYLNAAENENYAYHIDGDEDDSSTSSKDDKLLAMIQSDPDGTIDFMKQLVSGLYTNLGNKMKSSTLSSMYTVYNDKEMASEYSDYTTLISTWETRLADAEDRYYSQFTSMETALAKLQNSSSSITGLTG